MRHAIEMRGPHLCLRLDGRLDAVQVDIATWHELKLDFEAATLRQFGGDVYVDLRHVAFADSRSLYSLLEALRGVQVTCDIAFIGPGPGVERLMELGEAPFLAPMLEFAPWEENALYADNEVTELNLQAIGDFEPTTIDTAGDDDEADDRDDDVDLDESVAEPEHEASASEVGQLESNIRYWLKSLHDEDLGASTGVESKTVVIKPGESLAAFAAIGADPFASNDVVDVDALTEVDEASVPDDVEHTEFATTVGATGEQAVDVEVEALVDEESLLVPAVGCEESEFEASADDAARDSFAGAMASRDAPSTRAPESDDDAPPSPSAQVLASVDALIAAEGTRPFAESFEPGPMAEAVADGIPEGTNGAFENATEERDAGDDDSPREFEIDLGMEQVWLENPSDIRDYGEFRSEGPLSFSSPWIPVPESKSVSTPKAMPIAETSATEMTYASSTADPRESATAPKATPTPSVPRSSSHESEVKADLLRSVVDEATTPPVTAPSTIDPVRLLLNRVPAESRPPATASSSATATTAPTAFARPAEPIPDDTPPKAAIDSGQDALVGLSAVERLARKARRLTGRNTTVEASEPESESVVAGKPIEPRERDPHAMLVGTGAMLSELGRLQLENAELSRRLEESERRDGSERERADGAERQVDELQREVVELHGALERASVQAPPAPFDGIQLPRTRSRISTFEIATVRRSLIDLLVAFHSRAVGDEAGVAQFVEAIVPMAATIASESHLLLDDDDERFGASHWRALLILVSTLEREGCPSAAMVPAIRNATLAALIDCAPGVNPRDGVGGQRADAVAEILQSGSYWTRGERAAGTPELPAGELDVWAAALAIGRHRRPMGPRWPLAIREALQTSGNATPTADGLVRVVAAHSLYLPGSWVELTTGEIGIVLGVTPSRPDLPRLLLQFVNHESRSSPIAPREFPSGELEVATVQRVLDAPRLLEGATAEPRGTGQRG